MVSPTMVLLGSLTLERKSLSTPSFPINLRKGTPSKLSLVSAAENPSSSALALMKPRRWALNSKPSLRQSLAFSQYLLANVSRVYALVGNAGHLRSLEVSNENTEFLAVFKLLVECTQLSSLALQNMSASYHRVFRREWILTAVLGGFNTSQDSSRSTFLDTSKGKLVARVSGSLVLGIRARSTVATRPSAAGSTSAFVGVICKL